MEILKKKKSKFMNETKELLKKELNSYLHSEIKFTEYYPNMNILVSPLYKKQLQEVVNSFAVTKEQDINKFKLYLDTIIINMHTKIEKYKKSIYFDDENIKDIENQGYFIPFYIDKTNNCFIILGLIKSSVE